MSARIAAIVFLSASLGLGWPDAKPRVLVERVGSWSVPPESGQPSLADGRASIFYDDGRFAVINAILARVTQGRKPYFVLGEGYSVFSGCWSTSRGKARAMARPVYLPGLINPPPPPMTILFQFEGSDPLKSRPIRTITNAGQGLLQVDTTEVVRTVEARTRSYESSSGSVVWSCAKP